MDSASRRRAIRFLKVNSRRADRTGSQPRAAGCSCGCCCCYHAPQRGSPPRGRSLSGPPADASAAPLTSSRAHSRSPPPAWRGPPCRCRRSRRAAVEAELGRVGDRLLLHCLPVLPAAASTATSSSTPRPRLARAAPWARAPAARARGGVHSLGWVAYQRSAGLRAGCWTRRNRPQPCGGLFSGRPCRPGSLSLSSMALSLQVVALRPQGRLSRMAARASHSEPFYIKITNTNYHRHK